MYSIGLTLNLKVSLNWNNFSFKLSKVMKIIVNGPQDTADFCYLYEFKGNYFPWRKIKSKKLVQKVREKV